MCVDTVYNNVKRFARKVGDDNVLLAKCEKILNLIDVRNALWC